MEPENAGVNQETGRNDKGQFVPGISGNPAGKAPGTKSLTTKVKAALEKIAEGKDFSYEEALIKVILKKAIIDGDTRMIEIIWNYLDGKPNQNLGLIGEFKNYVITRGEDKPLPTSSETTGDSNGSA